MLNGYGLRVCFSGYVSKGQDTPSTTMGDLYVPEPNEHGLYSTSLSEDFETVFIRRIQTALAEPRITHANAGRLLYITGQEARLLQSAGLPGWPNTLSNLDACNNHIADHIE